VPSVRFAIGPPANAVPARRAKVLPSARSSDELEGRLAKTKVPSVEKLPATRSVVTITSALVRVVMRSMAVKAVAAGSSFMRSGGFIGWSCILGRWINVIGWERLRLLRPPQS